jgi:hypothetical protein
MNAMPKVGRSTRWLIAAVLGLCLYVGSYLHLTLQGAYAPGVYGADGPTSYRWAPQNFVRANGTFKDELVYFYAPLYLLDFSFWHVDLNAARDPLYP